MSQDGLKELIRRGESQEIEFKLGTISPEVAAQVVCAFLNTQGGTLLIGVADDGSINGVPNASDKAREIEEGINALISPIALWSVTVETVDEKVLIAVTVPPGPGRPYVCENFIYVRRGNLIERTQPAAPEDIRQIIIDQAGQATRWERLPASSCEFEDLDHEQIGETVSIAQRSRFMVFRDSADLSSVLSELGLQESGRLTNASQVLFAKSPAPRLPQTRIRATVFATDKGGNFLADKVFEGHIFKLFESLEAFLKLHVSVASKFDEKAFEREDVPAYPFSALREGVINALVHRDYSFYAGGMSLGIYPDRIEIWNSGKLPDGWNPRDLKKIHASLPPNPDIAHVLYLRGLIERVGRGTIKIIEECKAAGLPEPTWKQDTSGITLIIPGSRKRGVGKESAALNERQLTLVARTTPGESFTLGQYHATVADTASERSARRDLNQLVDEGWLVRAGATRNQRFVRTSKKQ